MSKDNEENLEVRYRRFEIIQKLLDFINGEVYLEIGVALGESFKPIIAKRKIAVEPKFLNDIKKFYFNGKCNYFECTSNEFFSRYAQKIFREMKADVIFIDGLHTYEQTLKDFENAIKFLSKDGFVVFHDCSPTSEAMAFPAESYEEYEKNKKIKFENAKNEDEINELKSKGWESEEWCGDVWKTILHLRSKRDDFNVFVLNCDYGVGVVKRGKNQNRINISINNLKDLPYPYLDKNRKKTLNLKYYKYIDEMTKKNRF